MFSVLSRSVARRSVYSGARWMSQVPPKGPQQPPSQQPPSSGEAGGEPQTSEPLGSTSQEAESSRRSNVPTLDFSPEPAEEAPQRTGAKSSRDSLSSSEQKRRKSSRVMMALMGLGLVGGAIHLGREWEEGELQEKRVVRAIFVIGFVVLTVPVETRGRAAGPSWAHCLPVYGNIRCMSCFMCISSCLMLLDSISVNQLGQNCCHRHIPRLTKSHTHSFYPSMTC